MTETIAGRRRLGRGLEALLGPTREEAEREGSLVELAIADIRPNPYQPRRDVDPAALEELTASIRKAGLLQPVVVRQAPGNNGGFELIAGERRDRKSTRLNSSHLVISYAVFCLKKKKKNKQNIYRNIIIEYVLNYMTQIPYTYYTSV